MSAHDERESIYRDLVAGRLAGDALRERVVALARAMGISATALAVDLRAEAWGLAGVKA